MGKLFIPPLKFIIYFIISAATFIFLNMLYNWVIFYSISLEQQNSLLLYLPEAANKIVFPAVAAGLLFTIFDSRKRGPNPFAAILTAAAVFLILFFGFKFTKTMVSAEKEPCFQPFQSRMIQITDDHLLYTNKVEGQSIKGLITRSRKERSDSRFNYYSSAGLEEGNPLRLKTDNSISIEITPPNPIFSEDIRIKEPLYNYLCDIEYFNQSLAEASNKGGTDFIILTAVFTAFLMISLLFKGLSAWPLFDFTLIIFLHRIIFYIFRTFSKESDFISETFFGGKQGLDIPLFTIAGLTILLFLVAVLTRVSLRKGKR